MIVIPRAKYSLNLSESEEEKHASQLFNYVVSQQSKRRKLIIVNNDTKEWDRVNIFSPGNNEAAEMSDSSASNLFDYAVHMAAKGWNLAIADMEANSIEVVNILLPGSQITPKDEAESFIQR